MPSSSSLHSYFLMQGRAKSSIPALWQCRDRLVAYGLLKNGRSMIYHDNKKLCMTISHLLSSVADFSEKMTELLGKESRIEGGEAYSGS